jgi:hypothetical protein
MSGFLFDSCIKSCMHRDCNAASKKPAPTLRVDERFGRRGRASARLSNSASMSELAHYFDEISAEGIGDVFHLYEIETTLS